MALQGFECLYVAPTGRFITLDEVRGSLAAIRAYGANVRGDAAGVVEHSRQALAQLPADASATRCLVALTLGLMHIQSRELDAALPALTEAVSRYFRDDLQAAMKAPINSMRYLSEWVAWQQRLSNSPRKARTADAPNWQQIFFAHASRVIKKC